MMPDAGERLAAQNQAPAGSEFLRAVLHGLAQTPKTLPCTYFYDATGARLFTRICRLPEYYLTRSEMALLQQHGGEIARRVPAHVGVVEFGSGSSRKIDLLLEHLDRPAAYVPVDVSLSCLQSAARALRRRYPGLLIAPVHADFTTHFELAQQLPAGPKLGFFPGSTLGNFDPADATALLRRFATTLGEGCQLIVGVDTKKDVRRLHAAYNDVAGVTAAFNLNLLRRVNRELGGTFDLRQFVHRAPYNRAAGRIEMHLISLQAQTVRIGNAQVTFRAGESIHTENSYKYSLADFTAIAANAGLAVRGTWIDRQRSFSVYLCGG